MKTSEQIANCSECREQAHRIAPSSQMADELYQETWLNIREREIKYPDWTVEGDYRKYFYKSMRFRYINMITREVKSHLDFNRIREEDIINREFADEMPCEAFLLEWIEQKPANDDDLFYKNILTLVLRCKNTNDAVNMCEISRAKFYEYLNTAKQKLRDDYFKTATNNDSDSYTMV